MAEVVLQQVSKRYEKTRVIEDVSLTVADREFVVLVGPSGCGKSTVLRMIAGLESITDGKIEIGGRLVADQNSAVPPKDRDIAMVFQNYALYPHMSVYDNMAFGLKMRRKELGLDKQQIDTKVKEAAKILDLDALLQRKPKQLSGGQRQRVALGRAIVRNPKVFLMDEPLSNLDAKLRVQMRSEIAKLHQRLNATTIYVTHDQTEAMTMGDRIVILNKGLIQQVDTPMKVYQYPANMFVAGFIGQMNFLPVTQNGDKLVLSTGEQLSVPGVSGKNLILGLRPEHFSLAGPAVLSVTPDRIERLGSEQMIHFPLGDQTILAKLPADAPVQEGQPVGLSIDVSQASVFDADTQLRLN